MRNLKKVLALIVTIALLASMMMVPALAATSNESQAAALKAIGLFKGTSDTEFGLDGVLTRDQAMALVIRTMGKETEALAMSEADIAAELAKVADGATIAGWARPYAAYALKNGITTGVGREGKVYFDATVTISGQNFVTLVLRAMGYTVDWTNPWDLAVTAKLLTAGEAVALKFDTGFIRDDAVGILYTAVKSGVASNGKILVENLIAAGAVDAQKAFDNGFVAAAPAAAALEVESVTAKNLKEVVVTFNAEVNEDTVEDANFNVSDFTGETASLQDDGVTVVVTLDGTDTFSNETEYTIEIADVENLKGTVVDDTDVDFTVGDYTLPTLEGIEFTGPQTAEITFSEPIDDGTIGDVTIDGGVYSATVDEFDGNTVNVDLGTELDEGVHSFKVKGFTDYVPYTMISKTIDVTYVDVDTAPVVTLKSASQTEVTLSFDRPVTGLEVSSFYHTYSSWKPVSIEDKDGDAIVSTDYYNEVTLVFIDPADEDNNRPLQEGKVKVVVLAESDNDEIEDKWGNNLDDDAVLYADITADETAPTITETDVSDDQQTVKFFLSEEVELGSVDADEVKIVDADGDVVKTYDYTRIVKVNADDEYYLEIVFDDAQEGTFEITVLGGINDTSLAENEIEEVTLSFDMEDTNGISLEDDVDVTCVDADDILYIDYGTEMAISGTYSVLNIDNYQLNGADIDEDDVTISMFTDSIVKIVFDDATALVGSDVTVARVEDAKGNLTDEIAYIFENIQEEAGPVVTAIEKIADNKLAITVSKDLKSVKTLGITVDGDDAGTVATAVASISFVNDGDDTVINVTLPSAEKDAGTDPLATGFTVNIVAGNIKSVTGAYMGNATYVVGGNSPVDGWSDGVAPKLATTSVGSFDDDKLVYVSDTQATTAGAIITEITIEYTEAIDSSTVSKYTYEVGGYSVDDFDVVGNQVILYISNDDSDEDNDVLETPTVTQIYNIEDLAGNSFKAGDSLEAISYGEADAEGIF